MTMIKTGLAAFAALGLAVSTPVMAQTRSAAALPALAQTTAAADCMAGSNGRACGAEASQMSDLRRGGFIGSPGFLIALLALIAIIVAAASGGNGNGPDSPG